MAKMVYTYIAFKIFQVLLLFEQIAYFFSDLKSNLQNSLFSQLHVNPDMLVST